ncbi:hypothetical protein EV182_002526 [Spiromyces aspiralis]|uniref:Uncharacterized protein n=1 Tax=Spiromyces aspiralis TaxID=68401 RepID=A0ACC1HGN6_9FUNG|nr:hypothetical protein EV182_002526 [Spiromyces aspiralis]
MAAISAYHTPVRSSSQASSNGASPAINTPFSPRNDDASERRARRKSAMLRGRGLLMSPRRSRESRRLSSWIPPSGINMMSPGNLAVQMPSLTQEELNQRYEEWMKIAADNKINVNNTWDFALIDYFYDLSLLREGDSINFQKASCTLDGCVKIYSSRVDSVASEAGKLLSGLADARKRQDLEGTDDAGDNDGEGAEAKPRKKSHRTTNTLAKDDAQINIRKFDLEFSVDPLFKKASADFDESGAKGLLLNNLAMDENGKIVFDASDAKRHDNDDADDENDDRDDGRVLHLPLRVMPFESLEMRAPQAQPLAINRLVVMDRVAQLEKICSNLDSLELCPSLGRFRFSNDTSLDLSAIKDSLNGVHTGGTVAGDAGDSSDNDDGTGGGAQFHNLTDDYDDNMDGFLEMGDSEVPEPIAHLDSAAASHLLGEGGGDIESEHASLAGGAESSAFSFHPIDGSNDILSYFDIKSTKSWTGPEHWRLPVYRPAVAAAQQGPADQRRKKAEKQKFYIDFVDGEDPEEDVMFALPTRKTMILMSKGITRDNVTHTLPEDIHYSSKNLFSLFLKPKLRFQARNGTNSNGYHSSQAESGGAEFGGFEMEGNEGALQLDIDNGLGDNYDDDDDFYGGDAPPTFLEHGDTNCLSGDTTIPEIKLIKPLQVNYARRAKRVNVKKLKDNIWSELVGKPPEDGSKSGDLETKEEVAGEQRFSDLVSGLKDIYPEDKLSEISVPFCFICLLHLANEKNLQIESDQSLSDLVIRQDHHK